MTGAAFAALVNAYETDHGHKTHAVGIIKANPDQSKHLETATMQLGSGWVDFVNLRAETYADDEAHRIPSMEFGTPLEDAQRRDFTINSLFYNLATKEVEDFTGHGLSDLRHGVIRTPLDPRITFLDDPLRVLRAIRFASRFQFPLAPDLVEALEQPNIREALVKKVSRERVGKELAGMLTGSHANPVVAIQCLHQFHLLDVVFQIPEGPFYSFQPAHTAASPTKVSIPSNWTDKAFASVQALHSLQLYRKDKVSDDTPSVETSSTTADGIEVATEGRANRAKLEMLAAVLLPLAEYSVLHKKKHVPVAHSIVRESIKFAAKEADHVSLVALNQCRRFVAIANAPFDRVQVGLLVREVGALWTVCADMAYLVEVVLEGVDVSSAREKYAALSTYVTRDAALDNVWEMKPLLNGKEVMEALALTPGPAVKAMNDAVIAYQLKFPSATRDDVLTHLVAL
ncbi:hypothetical protein, variant 2 [Aphanomyces invadans]|nr:hypothetical protein, variant 2 [Aphanomyces invadans]ETW05495.1 hypothetical protein, variant 2 [Aphanomyces invadans]|eukprot:XP_008865272.1 hypothetical protein, variant 2 [Aphanomyces invadans]